MARETIASSTGYNDIDKVVNLKNKKKGRYIITTAISSAKAHEGFIHALEYYAANNSASVYVLAGRSHNQSLEKQEDVFDEWVLCYGDDGKLVKNIVFNDNLEAIDLQLNPQNQNPLGGVEQFGRGSLQPLAPEEIEAGKIILTKAVSFIVAHPSQDMKTLVTGNDRHPRVAWCTGALTYPDYRQNTQGKKGESNHIVGALIVDVVDKDKFFVYQIQADKTGGFVHLGKYYGPNGEVKKAKSAITLGDLHPGYHDESAVRATKEMIKLLDPTELHFNDYQEGASVSHHAARSVFAKAAYAKHENFRDLLSEVTLARKVIADIGLKKGLNVMVPSNHPDFVTRRLHEGEYPRDSINFEIMHELALQMFRDPNFDAQRYLLKLPSNFVFPSRNEDVICNGHEIIHGDMGKAGAKGSSKTFASGYRKSISGHTHSPEIHRGAKVAGTLTKLRMGYNNGMQNWLHANVVTYEGGHYQMLFIIDGKWKV